MTPEQIEQARKGLASDNPAAVIYALKGLGSNGRLNDLQAVMKHVTSPNQKIKQTAIEATCTLIKENLIQHFHELDKNMREKLTSIMQSIHPSVLDEISKDLYSDNDDRRLRAVQILGYMRKNPKIKDILAKLVQDRDVKIKATAANLMGQVIGRNDHDLLLALLSDEDKRVRANTIEALEKLNNRRLIPILLRFKNDPNNRIRGNVLKALHTLGHTGIEEELLEMIKSSSNLMKASGMWVVSQIKFSTRPVIDACGVHLLSRDEMVHRNARNAVTTIDDPRAKGYLRYLADFFPRPAPEAAANNSAPKPARVAPKQ
jgi:hypothetical protein